MAFDARHRRAGDTGEGQGVLAVHGDHFRDRQAGQVNPVEPRCDQQISGLNVGVFPIGDLIMAIINFLCISFVVFWMVKIINRFNRKKADEAEPEPEAPAEPTTEELLAEILAELKLRNSRSAAAKTLDDAEKEESSSSER